MEEKEMVNINAHIIGEITFTEFTLREELIKVANFSLVKHIGNERTYINCSFYGERSEVLETYQTGELVHVFGYYKERFDGEKIYKNFIVKHINKIENDK